MAGKDAGKGDVSGLRGSVLRLSSLPGRFPILERIMTEAIALPLVQDYRKRAQAVFFLGADPAETAGYEGQLEAVGRCLEWFVFDYEIPELAKTPAQYWFEQAAETLNVVQRQAVRDCLRFVCGLFEVQEVTRGTGFEVLDLLRPPLRYVVYDKLVSEEVQEGQLLVGRLFPHQGNFLLSGMASLLNEQATARMKELVQDRPLTQFKLVADLDGITLEGFLGRDPAEIHGWSAATLRERFSRYLQVCGDKVSLTEIEAWYEDADGFETLLEELTELLAVADEDELEMLAMMLMALGQ